MTFGRLIFPVIAALRPFVGCEQDPDFKEPRLLEQGPIERSPVPSWVGDCIRLPCQVEPQDAETLSMHANGNAPHSRVCLIFHAQDMRRSGFTPEPRDMLLSICSLDGQELMGFGPRGLMAISALPTSFGLGRSPEANLLLVQFVERSQGARRGGQ